MDKEQAHAFLEAVYGAFHNPRFIAPDPLELVREASPPDREIAGLLSAGIAMGRVGEIVKTGRRLFGLLNGGGGIRARLLEADEEELYRDAGSFKFRFFKGRDLGDYLIRIKRLLARYGSLEEFLRANLPRREARLKERGFAGAEDYYKSPSVAALRILRKGLLDSKGPEPFHPMWFPDPDTNSAHKRLHLFLRWMVRRDEIDPGGWAVLRPEELWMPVDTHILRHGNRLGFTSRRLADRKAVLEISSAFAAICPEDPCKYDFSLSRMGIHPQGRAEEERYYRLS